MRVQTKALCWAAALFLLAAGNAAGLVAGDTAQVLFVTLPVVAWLSISGSRRCMSRGREASR